jgi:TPP-dependent pyruvate/acetoin dehydrogenase alpha subunit
LIDEAIESSIDPELLLAVALQALGLVDEEDKEEAEEEAEEEVEEAFKLELARSSIKGS